MCNIQVFKKTYIVFIISNNKNSIPVLLDINVQWKILQLMRMAVNLSRIEKFNWRMWTGHIFTISKISIVIYNMGYVCSVILRKLPVELEKNTILIPPARNAYSRGWWLLISQVETLPTPRTDWLRRRRYTGRSFMMYLNPLVQHNPYTVARPLGDVHRARV
jgi:hypothetical protein